MLLGLLVLALGIPAPSPASTAELTGSGSNKTLVVTAAAGEANDVNIWRDSDGSVDDNATGPYRIYDSDDNFDGQINAGSKCNLVFDADIDDDIVTCPASGVAHVQVDLGDMDDSLTFDGDGELSPSLDGLIDAGPGNDYVDLHSPWSLGGQGTFNGPSEIHGGPGNDDLTGGFGADTVLGEGDTDVVSGGWEKFASEGDDPLISGGSGIDIANLSSLQTDTSISLDDVANDDEGDGTAGDNYASDIEWVIGGQGNDTISSPSSKSVANLFSGGVGNDVLRSGGGDDTLVGGTGADSFDGGPGADTATYSDHPDGVSVTIGDGANDGNSSDGGAGDNVESTVENLVGGDGADSLSGSGSANAIYGGKGNDTISGGEASDTLDGQEGADTLSYAGRTVNVIADLNSTTAGRPGVETDSIASFANAVGGDGDDQLTGLQSAPSILVGGKGNDSLHAGSSPLDILFGGPDDDTLDGGTGSDLLYGEGGIDEVDYSTRDLAVKVVVSFGGGTQAQEFDTFQDIESAVGGAGNDYLEGDQNANVLEGRGGNDRLMGKNGPDTLRGGQGNDTFVADSAYDGDDHIVGNNDVDTVDYSSRSADLTVDVNSHGGQAGEDDRYLSTESVAGGSGDDDLTGDGGALDPATVRGGGGNDTLHGSSGREDLFGGQGNDTIYGGYGNDRLYGEGGDDTLHGEGDIDTLTGGAGNDTLDGGQGVDVADYSSYGPNRPVNANLSTQTATAFGEVDRLLVEDVAGGAGNDTLVGDAGSNRLDGNGGNDLLDGGLGADFLTGGEGNDSVTYQSRTAPVTVSTNSGWLDDGEQDEHDNVRVENIFGGSGDDTLTGDSQSNLLYGGPGIDLLYGNEGNDVLINSLDLANAGDGGALGGPGQDVLVGGNQQDWLIDNDGENDTFVCSGSGDGDVAVADFLPLDPIGPDAMCEFVGRFAPAA